MRGGGVLANGTRVQSPHRKWLLQLLRSRPTQSWPGDVAQHHPQQHL